MALKANPNILECLHSPMIEKVMPLGEELLAMRQSLSFPDDFPDLQRLRHVAIQENRTRHAQPGRSALETRHAPAAPAADRRRDVANRRVPVRVETHREKLLAVKRGELPWPEVDAWRKDLHRDFERALSETKLPERPDYEAANRFLIKARRERSNRDE